MKHPRSYTRRGFTFLEIMLVVVIIGILMALVGPRLVGRTTEARISATRAQLKSLEQSIKTFEMDTGTFPKDLDELLEAPSEHESSWKGPYVDSDVVPVDGWDEPFEYKFPGDNRRFDLWSKGPDKQSESEDDITNWTKKN